MCVWIHKYFFHEAVSIEFIQPFPSQNVEHIKTDIYPFKIFIFRYILLAILLCLKQVTKWYLTLYGSNYFFRRFPGHNLI